MITYLKLDRRLTASFILVTFACRFDFKWLYCPQLVMDARNQSLELLVEPKEIAAYSCQTQPNNLTRVSGVGG